MVDAKLVYAREFVVSAIMSSIPKEKPAPMIVSKLLNSQQKYMALLRYFSPYRWTSYCQKALWPNFKDDEFNAAAD